MIPADVIIWAVAFHSLSVHLHLFYLLFATQTHHIFMYKNTWQCECVSSDVDWLRFEWNWMKWSMKICAGSSTGAPVQQIIFDKFVWQCKKSHSKYWNFQFDIAHTQCWWRMSIYVYLNLYSFLYTYRSICLFDYYRRWHFKWRSRNNSGGGGGGNIVAGIETKIDCHFIKKLSNYRLLDAGRQMNLFNRTICVRISVFW